MCPFIYEIKFHNYPALQNTCIRKLEMHIFSIWLLNIIYCFLLAVHKICFINFPLVAKPFFRKTMIYQIKVDIGRIDGKWEVVHPFSGYASSCVSTMDIVPSNINAFSMFVCAYIYVCKNAEECNFFEHQSLSNESLIYW